MNYDQKVLLPDYDFPGEVLSITVREAVKQQKEAAATKNYTYRSDEDALQDFLSVNWAWLEEE